MVDRSIAALGVLGPDRQFAGIITERDLSWFVAQGRDAKATTVDKITNDFPVVVEGPIEEKEALGQRRRRRASHARRPDPRRPRERVPAPRRLRSLACRCLRAPIRRLNRTRVDDRSHCVLPFQTSYSEWC